MKRVPNRDPNRQVTANIFCSAGDLVCSGSNKFVCDELSTEARWERPEKYDWVMHAEEDAIHNAYSLLGSLAGCTMEVSFFPCSRCANHIVRSQISKLRAPKPDLMDDAWGRQWSISLEILRVGGVYFEQS